MRFHVVLKDKRSNKSETFVYENGISEYVAFMTTGKKPSHSVAYFEGIYNQSNPKEAIEVEVALQFIDSYSESIVSFVNNVKTADGGSHET